MKFKLFLLSILITLNCFEIYKSIPILSFVKFRGDTIPGQSAESNENINLMKHSINCGENGAINYIKLNTIGQSNNYSFKCIKSSNIYNSCAGRQSEVDTNGQGNQDYLFRHSIDCGKGSVLREFKLEKDGKGFFIKYTCCSAKIFSTDVSTSNPSEGGHEIDAKNFNVLSGFKFEGDDSTPHYKLTVNRLAV